MGMNAITCKGYADVKESALGKENRTSSDFDGSDLLKGAAFLTLMGVGGSVVVDFIAGEEENRNLPVRLEDGRTGDSGFDASLSSHTVSEAIFYRNELVFYGDQSGAEYTVTFKGLDDTAQIAHYGIRRIDMNTSAVEELDFALSSYHPPRTPGEALVQYNEIVKNGSTDKVALIDFEGNGNLPGLKLIAYAEIEKNFIEEGSSVYLKIAEGYLEAPQGPSK